MKNAIIGMLKTILTFEDQIAQLNKRVTHLTQEHEDLFYGSNSPLDLYFTNNNR